MELGYTPANLKIIRAQYRLTKKQVAEITSTSNPDAIYRWESDIDAKHHADMPHAKWCKLLAHLDINPHIVGDHFIADETRD